MKDKLLEQFAELKLELIKLDNAYVAGDSHATLSNLSFPVEDMSGQDIAQEYKKVAKRIYELLSLLNQDNCQ